MQENVLEKIKKSWQSLTITAKSGALKSLEN